MTLVELPLDGKAVGAEIRMMSPGVAASAAKKPETKDSFVSVVLNIAFGMRREAMAKLEPVT